MSMCTCEKCGKVLSRRSKKSHDMKWCSTGTARETRRCANDKRFSGAGCTETFEVQPNNPKQRYCSRRCNQQMRTYPVAPESVGRGMTEEQKNARHMVPLETRRAATACVADSIVLWTREQSYANWANLLGLKGLM